MDGQTLAAAIAISRGSGGGSFAPDISDPQDGDTLVYDGTEGKWVNGSGGVSGGGYLKVGIDEETMALDKTWNEIKTAIENGYYVSVVVYIPFIPECIQTRIDRCAGGVDYTVYAHWISGSEYGEIRYVTNSSDGYPIMQDDG